MRRLWLLERDAIHHAAGGQVLDLVTVFGTAMRWVGAGIVIGLVAAVAASRFLSSLLFGLASVDPVTLLLTTAVLAGVAALAAYGPRAPRVTPGPGPRAALRVGLPLLLPTLALRDPTGNGIEGVPETPTTAVLLDHQPGRRGASATPCRPYSDPGNRRPR